ncbi:MAG: helix-turn-helix transcriptional regulator [Stackebrandtia sp.]
MDHRDEVREFLTSRRAKISPEQTGLPPGSGRRVPGLRRAEVAILANMSVEYYARVERGNLAGVSETVLDAVARALQLDEAERTYLFDLARAANRAPAVRPRRRASKHWTPRPSLRYALDAVTAPALVRNGRMDILAANRLGYAMFADFLADPQRPPNFARFTFLDLERAHRFYPDWDLAANMTVAILRTEAGRDPHDRTIQDLVGELSTRSEEFRTLWAARNVRIHGSGVKQFHHGAVGELELNYDEMELNAEPGLTLVIFTAEPNSPSAERLRLLASWAATVGDPAKTAAAADPA